MNEKDLFAGFDNYTTSAELGLFDDGMDEAGFTPSSAPCVRLTAETIARTIASPC
ncbi:LxmA leader domain family RiPP [Amycolatopsis suaedae]|uniref:LxmA leader domain family RiPP n=1 Tax=Amycolatopsis suaedae TaxID=2510978 RepID=UPI0013EF3B99|nr:LxmA leader domain family RiPP [Amycolatopsis suaedae]